MILTAKLPLFPLCVAATTLPNVPCPKSLLMVSIVSNKRVSDRLKSSKTTSQRRLTLAHRRSWPDDVVTLFVAHLLVFCWSRLL
jgi:hypothetical protein